MNPGRCACSSTSAHRSPNASRFGPATRDRGASCCSPWTAAIQLRCRPCSALSTSARTLMPRVTTVARRAPSISRTSSCMLGRARSFAWTRREPSRSHRCLWLSRSRASSSPRARIRTVSASIRTSPPSPSLVEELHRQGVRLIGIDTPSVDLFDAADLPSHLACLRCDIAILEGLRLASVAPGVYELIALPLNLVGFEASPVRAVLRTLE